MSPEWYRDGGINGMVEVHKHQHQHLGDIDRERDIERKRGREKAREINRERYIQREREREREREWWKEARGGREVDTEGEGDIEEEIGIAGERCMTGGRKRKGGDREIHGEREIERESEMRYFVHAKKECTRLTWWESKVQSAVIHLTDDDLLVDEPVARQHRVVVEPVSEVLHSVLHQDNHFYRDKALVVKCM